MQFLELQENILNKD